MANWKLSYQHPCEQKPFLFYAAFLGEQQVALAKEWAPTLRADLQLSVVESEYFRTGTPWKLLQRSQPNLAAALGAAPKAIVIKGQIALHDSLDYLRETMELLSHLLEHGASGIYDPFALAWWSPQAWQELATQGGILNPFDHVTIFSSPQPDGSTWLHTRGLRKFGRPDLSVHNVGDAEIEPVKKMLDRFINFQALGGVIEPGRDVVMNGLEATYRPAPTTGDLDDPDFNNLHIEIEKV